MPDYNYSIFKPHKLCSYSPEPRSEVYYLKLNFNISKVVYLDMHNSNWLDLMPCISSEITELLSWQHLGEKISWYNKQIKYLMIESVIYPWY